MSNRKTINEKLEAAKVEKAQAEARIKQLEREQKEVDRKARSHRFCKRGGFMEKLLPDLATITDEQFETFFKSTTANNFGRKALAEIVAQNADKPADTASTDTAARTETNPAPKPTQTAKPQGATDGSRTGDAARVAG